MDKENSEIAKLTERIAKDPKSKLFVPLAEEYKKTGEIEMAIYVLTEGLKNNPGYVTARSVLGKLLLEKGDLESSQKEFEEVVKAIPDNLMAQRKLGELYAFQNRPDEAVKHLKIVFSANPRDAELASLVSDLEAGRDVSQRLHLPKPQPSSPEKQASQGTLAIPAVKAPTQAVPARPASPVPPVPPKTAAAEKPAMAKGAAGPLAQKAPERKPPAAAVPSPPAPPAEEEAEEPEDIVALEPLELQEPEFAAPEPEPIPDFLGEQDHVAAPFDEPLAEIPSANLETVVTEEPAGAEPFFAEMAPPGELETKDVLPDLAEMATDSGPETETMPELADMADESGIISAEIVEEAVEAVTAAEAAGEGAEKSDDFTTDTLAELYIAQGFYEKAIDIYERMLADKPTSKGLQNKLAKVREMAAEAGPAAAPVEETAQPVMPDADIFAEVMKEGSANGPDETAEAARESSFDAFNEALPRAGAQARTQFTDFEPREYVPPKGGFEPAEHKAEVAHAAAGPSKSSKRETIDRLETWLKNIKKEK